MIDTRFWHDSWIRKLNALDRYLFLYLISNDKCSFCGIYELPASTMAYECGIDEHDLETSMLPRLEPKVYYRDGWVYLPNFKKHHVSDESKNSLKGYENALKEVPDRVLVLFGLKPLEAPSSPSNTIASASASSLIGEQSSQNPLEDKNNNMGWNNRNDNEDELPVIGDDGEVEETDQEKLKKENAKVLALLEWGEVVRKKKFLDKPTQLKHIKLLKAQGISPTKIKDTFVGLVQSEYWKNQDRLPDFKTVVSTLKNER